MTRSLFGFAGLLLLVPSLLAGGCDSNVDASDADDGESPDCTGPAPVNEGPCPASWVCVDGVWVDSSVGDCVSECPVERPADGSACPQPDQQCSYWVDDEPCGEPAHDELVLCTASGWTTLGPRCSPPDDCPLELPLAGSSCPGELPYSCTYTISGECGDVTAEAACDLRTYTWIVNADEPCGACDTHLDAASCSASAGCRWLEPGCGEPPLPQAGCFAAEDCTQDSCDEGKTCTSAIIDPCWNSPCDACGAEALVCLPGDG
jgi:hypothetical protein